MTAARGTSDFYGDHLADIHDSHYSGLADRAAATLLTKLTDSGTASGLIVDLGCGSGAATAACIDAGFDALGVDVSAAMLDIARRRTPTARLLQTSIYAVPIPSCVAVAAFGEVFNYTNAADPSIELASVFTRIHDALVPGGLFLFDVANAGRSTATPQDQSHELSPGLEIQISSREDGDLLTRDIAVNGAIAAVESHTLRLWDNATIEQLLIQAGFDAPKPSRYEGLRVASASHSGYQSLESSGGWTVWSATK